MASEIAQKGLTSLLVLFSWASREGSSALSSFADGPNYLFPIFSLLKLRQSDRPNPDKKRLLHVLFTMIGDCADSRDRIFAALSIARDELVGLNQPDYRLSTEQVYTKLAKTWIASKNNLDIFSCCDPRWWPDSSSRLPSWVPDWRFDLPITLIAGSFETSLRIFNASLHSSVDCHFSKSGESEILSLSGFQVDTIDKLGDPI